MDIISKEHPCTGILLLGDFNQLPDTQLRSYPLRQLVSNPARKTAILDKIYSNISSWFDIPVVLPALTKSDHDTVMLSPIASPQRPKRQTIYLYRRDPDPNKKALLYHHIKHMDWGFLFRLPNCAAMVDYFYTTILSALDYYLPLLASLSFPLINHG